MFANKPIEPDVQNNLSGYNGRVYLIVLDDTHTAALRSQRVKFAARRFIERNMGANDVAAVVHTSGKTQAAQEFTTSKRLLLEAVDKFMGDKLRSSTMNRIDEEARTRGMRQSGDTIDDPDLSERGFRARNTMESIKKGAIHYGTDIVAPIATNVGYYQQTGETIGTTLGNAYETKTVNAKNAQVYGKYEEQWQNDHKKKDIDYAKKSFFPRNSSRAKA